MRRHQSLALAGPAELCLGRCGRPLTTRRGLVIGGGTVYPELNFTLPTLSVDATSSNPCCASRSMTRAKRCAHLGCAAVRITRARWPRSILREAYGEGRLKIHPPELSELDRIEKTVETIPKNEAEFIGEMMGRVDTMKFVPADYDL